VRIQVFLFVTVYYFISGESDNSIFLYLLFDLILGYPLYLNISDYLVRKETGLPKQYIKVDSNGIELANSSKGKYTTTNYKWSDIDFFYVFDDRAVVGVGPSFSMIKYISWKFSDSFLEENKLDKSENNLKGTFYFHHKDLLKIAGKLNLCKKTYDKSNYNAFNLILDQSY
jgi:hypothetical protein